MDAFVNVLIDALGKRFNFEALIPQKTNALIEISLRAAEFQDDDAFPAREDAGFQNVENKVVLSNEPADDGLLDIFSCVMNNDLFRVVLIHGDSLSEEQANVKR